MVFVRLSFYDGAVKNATDRRKFPRLEIGEDAYAVNESGKHLGRVSHAGGGGMLLHSEAARAELAVGERLHLMVVEPATGAQTPVHVEVRYVEADNIGLQFV